MTHSTMKAIRFGFALICLAVYASNLVTMSRWSESRGVYDDICYLRQAHLFQRFGLDGIRTDARRDDDGYFEERLKEIGFAAWTDPARWPCHTPMPGPTHVLQYPPGTGALLALFPPRHQVVPLYAVAGLIVCAIALLGLGLAATPARTIGAGLFGALAIYLMINPAKASYSMAPTMAICAVAGFVTAWWFLRARGALWPVAALGFLLGLSADVRLPNLFLAAGYAIVLAGAFLWSRTAVAFLQGLVFGMAMLLGLAPTLIANAVNTGSPLQTTYGSADVVAPAFSWSVLSQYGHDMQFVLILLAIGATGLLLRAPLDSARQVAWVSAANLAVNLAFFMSHPIFTPYYVVPIAMLTLWSVSFAVLLSPARGVVSR